MTKINIGPYVMGEKPAPLTYQFLDSTGAAIDLSGYTTKFQWQEHDGPASSANAAVSEAASGKVTYTFAGTEFLTAGTYRAQFWAGNGTNRYASVDIEFTVAVPVGTVPAI